VRPDQCVAHVLPLDAYDELTTFFGGFMLEASPEQFVSSWTRAETAEYERNGALARDRSSRPSAI
jgi:hypothetical protein